VSFANGADPGKIRGQARHETYPTINRWENGRAKPSPLALKLIEDLARGLGERRIDLPQEFFPEEVS